MKTIRLSATQARNNFFSLLNQVIYEGAQVIIDKSDTKGSVRITLEEKNREDHKKRMKALKEIFGIWKDVPTDRIYDDRVQGEKRWMGFLDKVRKGNA